jgi:hypothetical protein
VAVGVEFDTYLYAAKLEDVTDLANEIGQTYGGWYDVAKAACMVGGRWKSLCIGQAPAAWNYRVDHFAAAGINAFPDSFDDLLTAAKALHAKGTPIGMTGYPLVKYRGCTVQQGAQIGQLGTQRRLDRLLRLGIVGQRAHLAEGLGRLEYEIGHLRGRGYGAVVSTCMRSWIRSARTRARAAARG